MKLVLLVLSISLVSFYSCSTNRAFTKGEYTDPERVILLDDRFNESDMRIMADALVKSLEEHPIVAKQTKKPVFFVEKVINSTSEHIDMDSLTDKIKTALIKTGEVAFHDKQQRSVLTEEYDYQTKSGNVDQNTAKQRGHQIGSDYVMSGNFSSIVQEVGNKKVIYYKLTLNATDIKTGLISWSDEKEVKKLYKKRSVSL